MEWEPRFEVGVESIDTQHQELFDRITRLEQAMRANDHSEVTRMLDFLGLYVVKHFNAEELLMEERRYARRTQHKQAHDHFIQELLAMKSAFAATGETMSLSTLVHSFMMTWLRQHILVMDQELAAYLERPLEKAAPRAAKKKKPAKAAKKAAPRAAKKKKPAKAAKKAGAAKRS